jgi:hypothetical protein
MAFADDFELPEGKYAIELDENLSINTTKTIDNIDQIQEVMQNISLTLKPPDWLLK